MPRTGRIALLSGVLAALAALAFPFAPVHQDLTRVSWPAAGTGAAPVAVPLMPYQPSSIRATFSCATVAALAAARPAGATVLATTVDGSDTPWPLRYGLTVRVADGHLTMNVGERTVLTRLLDPGTDGSCEWLLESSAARTEVRRDGAVVASVAGDVRPQVAALLSDAPTVGAPTDGLSVQLTADSRFQTTIGPIKLALAVIAVLALAVALVMVWRADRGAVSAHGARLTHGRAWLPQPADGAVLAVLTVWTLIGPITVDDGYISGIVRGRDLNGYIGNYYHWFNAPEAPFGWFYELYRLWFELGTAPLWLRVPSAVLGMLCWLLLSRLVLPRLGPVLRGGRGAVWVAAAVFLTWWLAFAIGLRPEPWVAVGTLVVFCLVERGLATRRLLPLMVGLLVAGLTLAVTPTGVIAFAPYLASLRPLLRLARTRTDLAWAPLVAVTVAVGAAPLLVMFADQTFGAVVEATRVRTWIGPYLPWNQEIERYSRLLEPTLEGSLSRRVPVLFMLLALVVVGWQVRRGRLRGVHGIHRGAAARLLVAIALGLATFVFTPTKWTHHFGAFAGLGTAATVLGLRAITGDVIRTAQARAAGIAVVAAVGGLALSGHNTWPYVSDYDLTWHDVPPILLDIPIGTIMLYGGLALAIAVGLVAVWRETAGNRTWVLRWIPPPAPLVMAVIVLTLVIELGTFGKATIERRDTYTLAADSRAALTGDGCGLASFLRVEPDPRAGVLSPLPSTAGEAGLDGFTAVASGRTFGPGYGGPGYGGPGYGLPGWHTERSSPPATMRTGWYALAPELREGTLPVVVSVDRRLTPHSSLTVELGRTTAAGTVEVLAQVPLSDAGGDVGGVRGGQQDRRVLVPSLAPGADAVRVLAVSSGDITFAVPRAPRVIALLDAVPTTATVIADWPVSYLFPCYRLPSLANGLDELPEYRIGPPRFDDPSAGVTYAHDHGGPLASARALVREERLPLYLVGDPLRDAAQLYRWVLVRPLGPPSVTLERHTVPGWSRGPHITIPVDASLDPGRRGSS